MDRRTSCYLNSAYNRNVDDFDDYIDDESHLSFGSKGHSYESENETYVDAYPLDDRDSCFSEDDRLATFDHHQIGNRSYSLQQLQRYHSEAYAAADAKKSGAAVAAAERLTSTPKKQCLTPSGRKNPQRRVAIVRRRSLSSLSHRDIGGGNVLSANSSFCHQSAAIRRSKSSLTLRPPVDYLQHQQHHQQQQQQQLLRYGDALTGVVGTAPAPPPRRQQVNRYLYDVRPLPAANVTAYALSDGEDEQPLRAATGTAAATAISPFHVRQPSSRRREPPRDLFAVKNPFLRRPYDLNSSSASSSRPLVARNTAVISPIYAAAASTATVRSSPSQSSSSPSPFDALVERSQTFSMAAAAADRSVCSSTKTTCSSSWLHQMRKPRLPLCALRTSAITLLVSGTLTCLLCIHIISQRGKSYELTFSLICGFVVLCLGFPCLRFQQWQWLPNRNYVSGYIILSLFSLLQSSALWILDKYYTSLQPELIDLLKGALCGVSTLSLSLAVLGVCASCCCKYPPPDNRVNHGVQGFTV